MKRLLLSRMTSRRHFLSALFLTIAAFACRRQQVAPENAPAPARRPPVPAGPPPLAAKTPDGDGARIDAEIPARTLFPNRKPGSDLTFIRATSLRLRGASEVSISFAGGSELRLPSSSFRDLLRQHNRITRDAVAVKSIVAWTLDSLHRAADGTRDVEVHARLRQQFHSFQEQPVLEAVSPGALLELAKAVEERKPIQSIQWNPENSRFLVEGG